MGIMLRCLGFFIFFWTQLVYAEEPFEMRPVNRGSARPYQYQRPPEPQYTPQQPQAPDPNLLVPENRSARSSAEVSSEKEYTPWEYERTDTAIARELQRDIDESYMQGRIRSNPLSPKRIKELQKDATAIEEAKQPPRPEGGVSRFKNLSLEPGASIPDVHLFPGNTTILRFVDSTGAPWPILSYVLGSADGFTVQNAGGGSDNATNILIITPRKPFADTSLAVTLYPDVPTVLFLHASVRNMQPDFLVTFRADARGPNATMTLYKSEENALVSEVMLSFLDGVPPKGAKRMKAGYGIQAWVYNDKCYVRTDRSLIWPAYSSIVRNKGAHDMRVYELPKVASVVVDVNGSPSRVKLAQPAEFGDYEETVKENHRKEMER